MMIQAEEIKKKLFSIASPQEFNDICLEIFQFQYQNNSLYGQFCDLLKVKPDKLDHYTRIPFLPIEFFKKYNVLSSGAGEELLFLSSGTSGMERSKHYVIDGGIYRESLLKGFEKFYGDPAAYTFFALLPSYLEQGNSSLVYMVKELISRSADSNSGFYLHDLGTLSENVHRALHTHKKIFLIGVSYALLDLAEKYPVSMDNAAVIMETGGMKGRRKEMVRAELHAVLKQAFSVEAIHSEYGMTELLSQAYALKDGRYRTPPWMKVLIRDVNDPLSLVQEGKTGGINVIDLANLYSCSFIATQDLGKYNDDGSFEVLGRFDSSDVRGCNLMVV